MIYPNEKNHLYTLGNAVLHAAKEFIEMVEKAKMTNEQFFLNWEDKLNELSVKDHDTLPMPAMSEQAYRKLEEYVKEEINTADSDN